MTYALRYLLIGFATAGLLSLWIPSSMVSALTLVWVGMVIVPESVTDTLIDIVLQE